MDASQLDHMQHLAGKVRTHRAQVRAAEAEVKNAQERLQEAHADVATSLRALEVASFDLLQFAEANA